MTVFAGNSDALSEAALIRVSFTPRNPETTRSKRAKPGLSLACGGGGIRTLGAPKGTTVFETAPFDHSGTPPWLVDGAICPRRKDSPARSISGEESTSDAGVCSATFVAGFPRNIAPPHASERRAADENGFEERIPISTPCARRIAYDGRNALNATSCRVPWTKNLSARGIFCISTPAPCVRSAPPVAPP